MKLLSLESIGYQFHGYSNQRQNAESYTNQKSTTEDNLDPLKTGKLLHTKLPTDGVIPPQNKAATK